MLDFIVERAAPVVFLPFHYLTPLTHAPPCRRNSQDEYVLDFIVERKSVQDLVGSIKGSSRFERQKVRAAAA